MTDEPRIPAPPLAGSNGAGDLSDEQLVEAYRSGEQPALDTLFKRYLVPLLAWLFNNSFFPSDEDYLLEVRDDVFLKLCAGIRKNPNDGGFSSRGPGSFHGWLWTIARLECLNADKKRRRLYLPFSQAFLPVPSGTGRQAGPAPTESDSESISPEDNILFRANSEPDETEYARMKLDRAFKNLKPEEVKLLQLSVRMKYKDIIKLKEFSRYKTIDSLRHKVHNIMEKIRKMPKD